MNAEPKLAATILLLRNDPLEVLMVQRRQGASFSAALVFPGGVVDEEDASDQWLPHLQGVDEFDAYERALRVAACREAFEETSVLVGAREQPAALGGHESFLSLVRNCGFRLPLGEIERFGHWITPPRAPKRFDTHFFACAAPPGATPRCDENETVKFEWMRPGEALERAEKGDKSLLFPTVMNLKRLNESQDVASALAAARARPHFTVTPRVERRPHGLVVCIPEEAGYGVTEYAAPEVAGRPA